MISPLMSIWRQSFEGRNQLTLRSICPLSPDAVSPSDNMRALRNRPATPRCNPNESKHTM
eukprot:8366095-Alexandrium_andersonii.AAC.1